MIASILQWAGAAGVLGAFALSQRGTWPIHGLPYLVTNLVAGACLAVAAALSSEWGYTFLEGVWAIIALRGMIIGGRAFASRRVASTHNNSS